MHMAYHQMYSLIENLKWLWSPCLYLKKLLIPETKFSPYYVLKVQTRFFAPKTEPQGQNGLPVTSTLVWKFDTTPWSYEHAQFITNFCHQYDRLNNLSCSSDLTSCMKNLIFNNYKILYSSKSSNNNQLLIIEALHIKFIKSELNLGLKASKELSLFT